MGMLPSAGQGHVGSMLRVPLIAIVDNDDALRESLDNLLRSVGWRTQEFASAEAFLQTHHPPETNMVLGGTMAKVLA
jgi:FixJ family two-component response regulator